MPFHFLDGFAIQGDGSCRSRLEAATIFLLGSTRWRVRSPTSSTDGYCAFGGASFKYSHKLRHILSPRRSRRRRRRSPPSNSASMAVLEGSEGLSIPFIRMYFARG